MFLVTGELATDPGSKVHRWVLAEGFGEWDTVDVLAVLTLRVLSKIEDDEEEPEEKTTYNPSNDLHYHLSDPVLLREVDVGKNDEGTEEAEQESSEVGEVIDPRQETSQKQDHDEE